jgi:hypothetical protein
MYLILPLINCFPSLLLATTTPSRLAIDSVFVYPPSLSRFFVLCVFFFVCCGAQAPRPTPAVPPGSTPTGSGGVLQRGPNSALFTYTPSDALESEVASVQEVIASVPTLTSIISLIHDTRSGGEFSHRLFEIYSSNDKHFIAGCFINPVSNWAFI